MTRFWRLAIIVGVCLMWAVPAQAQRPQARAVDGVDGILDVFKRYPVVTLGEDHGNVAQHQFLRKLVSDPRFGRTVDAVVIEAGSARQQDVIDRSVAGERVSWKALAQTWRDSVGGGAIGTWDAPIYEQFLRTIRRANRGRPAEHRVRLLLGDPPVDWAKVRTAEDLQRWAGQRDRHMASVVDRQVLRKRKRALMIAGVFHLHRDRNAPAKSALTYIDEKHPGKAYNVALRPFDPTELGPAFNYTRSFPANSLVPIDGTDLGAVRQPRPPGAPPAPTEEENSEAWFIPDLAVTDYSNPYPTNFEDAWWKELARRNRLAEGKFDPEPWFAVHCFYSTLQGAGLRQLARVGPASGEPRPAGSGVSGQSPQAAVAAAAIRGQLAAGEVVAIGDARALEEEHSFLRELIAAGRLPGRSVIVVGFGNSRYQSLLDAYLKGVKVPGATLARVWQDTSQLLAYDAPAYEQFFKAVRDANAKLPTAKRIRVLLSEPPLDWASVRSAGAVRKVVAGRAAFMARLVKRHGMKPGRSVIVVADRRLVARVPGSVTDRLPAGRSWVLQPYIGFGAAQAALEGRLGQLDTPSVLRIRGSWLQDLQSGVNLAAGRPRQALGQTADALLYVGSTQTHIGSTQPLTTTTPLPTRFRDRYVRAIKRRHRLLYGTRFDPVKAFPTSRCSTPAEDVGGGPPEPGGPPPASEPGATQAG